MDLWEMIFDQRRQLTGILETLDETQWDIPSLCSGWAVRDVVGHLVSFQEVGVSKVILRMLVNGFNFNKMNAKLAKDVGKHSPAELIGLMRKHTESRWTPPGLGPDVVLSDAVLHTEDICRPLAIQAPLDANKARVVLDFLVGPKGRVVTKPDWIKGLQLAPHDVAWTWGHGPQVNGTASDIIVVVAGRRVALESLTGEGAAQLRSRIAAAA
jgi:uncharacterized protein (TIGR03083 family)